MVFAHGSGSSRHSIRNRYVAEVLTGAGFATLLFDLLTPEEERNRANVFDIELLASRLIDVTGWLATQPDTASLPVGYFGASTGAGAALVAAADPRVNVRAVVSRGGRPDLAGDSLGSVVAPTLLIVGGRDQVVLELNQRAQAVIPGKCQLTVVPGATHLFEEPGTLEQVAKLACDWFIDTCAAQAQAAKPLAGRGDPCDPCASRRRIASKSLILCDSASARAMGAAVRTRRSGPHSRR